MHERPGEYCITPRTESRSARFAGGTRQYRKNIENCEYYYYQARLSLHQSYRDLKIDASMFRFEGGNDGNNTIVANTSRLLNCTATASCLLVQKKCRSTCLPKARKEEYPSYDT